MTDTAAENVNDLVQTISENERIRAELAYLFGTETVDLAYQIDSADLNLNEKMIDSISAGVRRLKELKHDPGAQLGFVRGLEQGTRLLLCMWIMDMDLLGKIRDGSYLDAAG